MRMYTFLQKNTFTKQQFVNRGLYKVLILIIYGLSQGVGFFDISVTQKVKIVNIGEINKNLGR